MKCKKCGNELNKDDKFCSNCGERIEDAQRRRMQFYESSNPAESEPHPKNKGNQAAGLYVIIAVLVMVVFVLAVLLMMNTVGNSKKGVTDGYAEQTVDGAGVDSKADVSSESSDVKKESESDDGKTGAQNDKDNKDNKEDTEKKVDWQKLYLDFIADLNKQGDAAHYIGGGLLYVDDDDIPELFLEGDCEATGYMVLTCGSGEIDTLQTARLCFTYIEKKNLLNNGGGHMGYYYDYIYSIEDGEWKSKAKGEYHEEFQGEYGEGEPDYVYTWNGKNVTESEYQKKLDEVYDGSKADMAKRYSFKELESLIKTGKESSVEHRYELIVDDVTWSEAERICRQKGGYLATLTTKQEFEKVSRQIADEEKTNISFFIGATRDTAYSTSYVDDLFSSYFWVNDQTGVDSYSEDYWYWLSGEPSYKGIDADGYEVEEQYVDIIYRKADNRCYLNDVANDILREAPGFSGRIGYICEYD